MTRFNINNLKEYVAKAESLNNDGRFAPGTKEEIGKLIDGILTEISKEMAEKIDRVIRKFDKKHSAFDGRNRAISAILIDDRFKGKRLTYFKRLKKMVDEEAAKRKEEKCGKL